MPRFELYPILLSKTSSKYGLGTHEYQTGKDIQPQGSRQTQDDVPKNCIGEKILKGQTSLILLRELLQTLERQQQGRDRHIDRNEGKPDQGKGVPPFRTLRPITEGEDETHDEQAKIEVVDEDIGDVDAFEVESWVFKGGGEDREGDVVVCESEP